MIHLLLFLLVILIIMSILVAYLAVEGRRKDERIETLEEDVEDLEHRLLRKSLDNVRSRRDSQERVRSLEIRLEDAHRNLEMVLNDTIPYSKVG